MLSATLDHLSIVELSFSSFTLSFDYDLDLQT